VSHHKSGFLSGNYNFDGSIPVSNTSSGDGPGLGSFLIALIIMFGIACFVFPFLLVIPLALIVIFVIWSLKRQP
jgi:hypothetical protein